MTARDFVPREYQHLMIEHMHQVDRCAVWAQPGLGKTSSVLTVVNDIQLIDNRPVLVIAPLRVARDTWRDEARKWKQLQHLRVMPIIGNEAERLRALKADANIYTINFEQIPWLVEQFEKRPWPFATVVADESTKLKGFRLRQGTQRAKALAQVAHAKVDRFIELTGTPSPNGLADLWGQMWFLDKGARLGKTFDAFRQRWFEKSYDGFSITPKESAQGQIQRALQDLCITVEAKDWFDLHEPVVVNLYVDLPAKARALYEDMEKRMFMEIEEHAVEAFGAAARTGKCIAAGTDLLTSNGWKRIEDWQPGDRLWDGEQWVEADALICNGKLPVVKCLHVTMTPDHKVLTTDGWKTAKEINNADASCGFNRAPVRVPDRAAPCWHDDGNTVEARYLDGSVRLRERVRSHRAEPAWLGAGGEKILRLPAAGNAAGRVGYARYDRASRLGDVAEHEVPLRESQGQRLAQLRRTRGAGLQRLARLWDFLVGYVHGLRAETDAGAYQQQRQLRTGKLPVGQPQRASEQYAAQCFYRHACRADDGQPSSRQVRDQEGDIGAALAVRVDGGTCADTALVYDLVNCGPRHRFTVRGTDGELLIVHNCLQLANGAAYVGDGSKEWRPVHDAKLQVLEELVEESAGAPVLVAYNFKSDLERLRAAFPDGLVLSTQEGMAKAKAGHGRIWFGHPASMGHGVDGLQYHCNILAFFGHDWNLENRLQMIERIGPTRQMQAGKDRAMFIYNILARGTVDELVLERVTSKREVQDILLDAMKIRRSKIIV